ncbi:MAG: prolyl oligopeptidase family serine peptidase [Bacteroidota bacterium]
MNKLSLVLLAITSAILSFGQVKKTLGPEAYDIWQEISSESISPDGNWICHTTAPYGDGNTTLHLKEEGSGKFAYTRGSQGHFTHDSKFLLFTIQADFDRQRDLRRIKTHEELLPRDSLAIYNLATGEISKYSGLKSLKVPEKWSGYVAYQLHPLADTTGGKPPKKWKKDKGYPLVIQSLASDEQWRFPSVTDYVVAKEGPSIAFITKGDSTMAAGVYAFDATGEETTAVTLNDGSFYSLVWDDAGQQLAFLLDSDTTKALRRNPDLLYWKAGMDTVKTLERSTELGQDEVLSTSFDNHFSEDGSRLFFGWGKRPVLQDTSLLKEEIVNVEIWGYQDQRLHTQQKVEREDDLERSFLATVSPSSGDVVMLADPAFPEITLGNQGNGEYALLTTSEQYMKTVSWEGFPVRTDLYAVNVDTGNRQLIGNGIRGNARVSPGGKYAYWYSLPDSAWFTYSFAAKRTFQVTNNAEVPFYREIHDTPSLPNSYGTMSWTEDDGRLLIYDRYDIWEIHPENQVAPINQSGNGRAERIRYRYQKADKEERFIEEGQPLLVVGFDEDDKREILYRWHYGRKGLTKMGEGPYHYSGFVQAAEAENLMFRRENFIDFPDIYRTSLDLKDFQQVSKVNPQQSDYHWGTAEVYSWTSLDGHSLDGLLIKPDNFDPSKKYPLIVNFYERSSDGLNRHRPPSPGRSTISYSLYASKGYVIFNPDIHYREGYPGESAYNCVIPGVTALIDEGFIDKDRIGVQGHSWGGYQIAHLITKTDIFRCAEAGAPVPNMISAYGGIRWWTGLSRMFQYEQTQSRIGGTLWEYPMRYIENSPIFNIDKINTPVLIMHNDADGHVPWYQGIEFFVSLRRLGKPSWMLNYQGEPHWPLKKQNKIDFQTRLAQFFDHYLMDEPLPAWMARGIPATEVGIRPALELLESDNGQ